MVASTDESEVAGQEVDRVMMCPRCGRVDQVAKVAGIVARGTQHSYKSDWRTSSSLDEDNDVQLSFGFSDTSTIKQSTFGATASFS